MRDLVGLREVNLPSWCSGLTPASPFSNGPGTIGMDIQIGGQTVCSGDVVVADLDGVIVIPFAELGRLPSGCHEILNLEIELDSKVRNGLTVPQNIKDLLEVIRWNLSTDETVPASRMACKIWCLMYDESFSLW